MEGFGTKLGGVEMTAEERLGNSTPEYLTDWLIKYHGLDPQSREIVVLNLKTQNQANRAIGFVEGKVKSETHIHFSIFGRRKE